MIAVMRMSKSAKSELAADVMQSEPRIGVNALATIKANTVQKTVIASMLNAANVERGRR